MNAMIVMAALAYTPPTADEQPNGTVYRKFDYALMAKIHAQHVAAKEAKRCYDPVTLLPIKEEKPAPRAKSARQEMIEQERRDARRRMVAMRKQQRQQSSGYDPLWWVKIPAVPTKPCPWAMMSFAASMSHR